MKAVIVASNPLESVQSSFAHVLKTLHSNSCRLSLTAALPLDLQTYAQRHFPEGSLRRSWFESYAFGLTDEVRRG